MENTEILKQFCPIKFHIYASKKSAPLREREEEAEIYHHRHCQLRKSNNIFQCPIAKAPMACRQKHLNLARLCYGRKTQRKPTPVLVTAEASDKLSANAPAAAPKFQSPPRSAAPPDALLPA